MNSKQEEMTSSLYNCSQSFSAAEETVTLGQTPPRYARTSPTEAPIMNMSYYTKDNQDEGKAVFDEISDDDSPAPSSSNSATPTLFVR